MIEAEKEDGKWVVVLDKSDSEEDFNIDYQILDTVNAKSVRLRITKWPEGITPGVISFCVFGKFLK